MVCWKLSPSQLTFGFSCPRCFYVTVRQGWKKPRDPFPKVFGILDRAMRSYWNGRSTAEFAPELPNGKLDTKEYRILSKEFSLPGRTDSFQISGRTDCLIHFSNGGYGIADFKTSELDSKYLEIYSRQLHCYSWGFENPASNVKNPRAAISPITRMGLMVYVPEILFTDTLFSFPRRWIEIPRNDAWFEDFMGQILSILESPTPPTGNEHCDWCMIRDKSSDSGQYSQSILFDA